MQQGFMCIFVTKLPFLLKFMPKSVENMTIDRISVYRKVAMTRHFVRGKPQ